MMEQSNTQSQIEESKSKQYESDAMQYDHTDIYNTDLQDIQNAIIQEKYSCSIFPYLKDPLERIMKLLVVQENRVNVRDIKSDEMLYMNIYKMELERIKYTVKSYLRVRLAKISKYLLLIVNQDYAKYLSNEEFNLVCKLYELRIKYFNEELISHIPDDYGYNIGEKNMKPDMIINAKENEWVAAKANKLITELPGFTQSITIKAGDKILIPYKCIKKEVMDSNMQLI